MSFGVNELKFGLRLFFIYKYQNLSPQLLQDEGHNSNACSRGNSRRIDDILIA